MLAPLEADPIAVGKGKRLQLQASLHPMRAGKPTAMCTSAVSTGGRVGGFKPVKPSKLGRNNLGLIRMGWVAQMASGWGIQKGIYAHHAHDTQEFGGKAFQTCLPFFCARAMRGPPLFGV